MNKQQESAASSSVVVLSFFFYASGTILQNGMTGLLQCLLLQLISRDVSSKSAFYDICRERHSSHTQQNKALTWHRNDLQMIFEKLVLGCSGRLKTKIFIDAIDECVDEDRDRLIAFFHSLKGRAERRLERPGIMFTCRQHPDGQIDADYRIRLEDENKEDIRTFIDQELRLPDETEAAKNELKGLLQRQADGLFLWLVLIIPQVHMMNSEGKSMKVIRSEVLKCPQELDGLYEDLLKKVNMIDLLETGRLLQWICFAERPLSIEELRIAMTVSLTETKSSLEEYEDEENPAYIPNAEKMKKKMIHLSAGLVDIADTKSVDGKPFVGFYHGTIKAFMLRKGLQYLDLKLARTSGLVRTSNVQLANTCLSYISTKEIRETFTQQAADSRDRFPFLDYATNHWLAHAVSAENVGVGQQVRWPSQDVLDIWISIRRSSPSGRGYCPEVGTSLMHLAAKHGLEGLARRVLVGTTSSKPATAMPETKIMA